MLGCVGSQGFEGEQAAQETCPHGGYSFQEVSGNERGYDERWYQVQILMCAAKTGTKPKTEILLQSETGIIYLW